MSKNKDDIILTVISLVFSFTSLIFIGVSIFSEPRVGLFLPIALGFGAVANLLNMLRVRKQRRNKNSER